MVGANRRPGRKLTTSSVPAPSLEAQLWQGPRTTRVLVRHWGVLFNQDQMASVLIRTKRQQSQLGGLALLTFGPGK